MTTQLTPRELNDKKWQDNWENMLNYIKPKLKHFDLLYLIDEHSIGISKNNLFFQIYGAEESFKFDDNAKVVIKAMNKSTGKLVKIFEINKQTREVKRCSQAHIIHNTYKDSQIELLQGIRDAVKEYFRPNAIKFITDD